MTDDSRITQLDQLLEDERRVLLAGELSKLAHLLPKKESLIDALGSEQTPDRDALEALNQKVERNQLLLDSALDGIRSVARRLATLRRVRTSLETYDADGRKKSIGMSKDGRVEKRA